MNVHSHYARHMSMMHLQAIQINKSKFCNLSSTNRKQRNLHSGLKYPDVNNVLCYQPLKQKYTMNYHNGILKYKYLQLNLCIDNLLDVPIPKKKKNQVNFHCGDNKKKLAYIFFINFCFILCLKLTMNWCRFLYKTPQLKKTSSQTF